MDAIKSAISKKGDIKFELTNGLSTFKGKFKTG